jgi:hypothetical protein
MEQAVSPKQQHKCRSGVAVLAMQLTFHALVVQQVLLTSMGMECRIAIKLWNPHLETLTSFCQLLANRY